VSAGSGRAFEWFQEKLMSEPGGVFMSEPLEIPIVFKYHVFTCYQQRPAGHPRGSCMEAGAKPLWERLGMKVEAKRLTDVQVTATGCMSFCRAGPLMVVYPEGIWYAPRTAEDIDEIIESHFEKGAPVERLIIVPQR
jgi:(2Fe-2S) ferredoxin